MTLLYIRATIPNDHLETGQSLEDLSHLKCYELQVCNIQRTALHMGEVCCLYISFNLNATFTYNELLLFRTQNAIHGSYI